MSAPFVVPAEDLSARFDPRTGNTGKWLGADSARSVPLNDSAGRVLWLFADTYWRDTDIGIPTSRGGSTLTSDSLGMQYGPDLATAALTFHRSTNASQRWFPISETHYAWPMDGVVIGDDLYVFSTRVLASSPLGGEYGWCVHKVADAKTLPVTSWVSSLLYESADTGTRPGVSPYVEGGYVYSFAVERHVGWLWNRWTLSNFTGASTQGSVEWYTGAGWSLDVAQAMTISGNADTAEGSVHKRDVDGRWMITDSVGDFPLFKGGVRLAVKDGTGSYPVAGIGGYRPPPPDYQPGDHVLVGNTYNATIQSVNPDGSRVVKFSPFYGGGVETFPLADLSLVNSSSRAVYENPRHHEVPMPPDYWTYAYKAHPSLPGDGLVVSYVDNGVFGAPLDIYWPKFYRILPPTINSLVVTSEGVVMWQSGGAPDRILVQHNGGAWVEINPTETMYELAEYAEGDSVTIRAIGIGGETVRSTNVSEAEAGPLEDAEWLIIPRERDLSRLHDPVSNWTQLKLVERHNLPDTWTVTGPSEFMAMFQPAGGSILYRGGRQITSGNLTNLQRSRGYDPGTGVSTDTTTATFASDLMLLGQRVVLPTPLHAMSTTAVFNFPDAYDLRSGPVESIMLDFIQAHAGSGAQADRRVARLRLPVSRERGGYTQVSGRFDHLGTLLQSLAEAGNLSIRMIHTEEESGAWLDVVIEQVRDLAEDVRFGTADSAATGIITDWNYELGMPTTTRSVIAGGGELEARDMLLRRSDSSEILWGVVVETLVDQRQVPPLGSMAPVYETNAMFEVARDRIALSIWNDQFLRAWVAGSTMTRTSQLAWGWLVGWDGNRGERDLSTEYLADISRHVRETTGEDDTVDESIDALRDYWATARQIDDDIRQDLDQALKSAWEPNELAHAAAIIDATTKIDQRIVYAQAVSDSLDLLAYVYSVTADKHRAERVNATYVELSKGGDEALDAGAGLVKVEFTPTLGPDLEYRRDVRLGDIVGYDLPGLEPSKDKIREATTTVTVQSGTPTETVSVVIGTPDAPTSRTQQQAARALRNVSIIQRST